jgi:hypothetical protein
MLRKSNKGKSRIDLKMMERVGDRWGKMEEYFSTGQSPQRAVVPMEEEEEEEEEVTTMTTLILSYKTCRCKDESN